MMHNEITIGKKKVKVATLLLELFILMVVFSIAMIIQVIRKDGIRENPGEAWKQTWANNPTIDKLEANWSRIEDEWASRGVRVQWEAVENELNKLDTLITSDMLLRSLVNHNDILYMVVVFLGVIASVCAVVLIKMINEEKIQGSKNIWLCFSLIDVAFFGLLIA